MNSKDNNEFRGVIDCYEDVLFKKNFSYKYKVITLNFLL